jgi:hypothetical protein
MSHVIPCVCRVRFLADHKSDPVMSSRDIAMAFIMSATPVLKIIAVANDIDEMFLTLEDECLVLYGCYGAEQHGHRPARSRRAARHAGAGEAR